MDSAASGQSAVVSDNTSSDSMQCPSLLTAPKSSQMPSTSVQPMDVETGMQSSQQEPPTEPSPLMLSNVPLDGVDVPSSHTSASAGRLTSDPGEDLRIVDHQNALHETTSFCFASTSYECSICGFTFLNCTELQKHMTTHKNFDTFECPMCERDFLLAFQLKQHLDREHHKLKLYPCSICSKKFSCIERAVLHEELHDITLAHSCDTCDKSFHNLEMLFQHQRSHVSWKKSICNLCHAKFDFPSELVVHLRTHTREEVYECPDCDKTFASVALLKHHARSHGAEDYMCGDCELNLADLSSVTSHVLNFHQKHEMQVCSSCKVVFTSLRDLDKHRVEHHCEKFCWRCNHCDRVCDSEMQLQDHKEVCSSLRGKRRRNCKVCGLAFQNIAALKKHKEIVGKFECPDCEVLCVTACHLARHLDQHVAYTCDLCNEVFYGRKAYNHHRNQHIPFPICIICERTFKSLKALRSHLRRMHKLVHASVCPVCCQYFSSNQQLDKHRNSHRYQDAKRKAEQRSDDEEFTHESPPLIPNEADSHRAETQNVVNRDWTELSAVTSAVMADGCESPAYDVSASSLPSTSDLEDAGEDPDFSLSTALAETCNEEISLWLESKLSDVGGEADMSQENQGPVSKKRKTKLLNEGNLLAALNENVLDKLGGNSDGDSEASDIEAVLQAMKNVEDSVEEYGLREGLSEDTISRDINMPDVYITKVLRNDFDIHGRKKKSSMVYNRKDYCPVCKKFVADMLDHTINQKGRKHKDAIELKSIHDVIDEAVKSDGTKRDDKHEEMLQMIRLFRSRANHNHNKDVLQQKRGEIILGRRAVGDTFDVSQFGPCPHCLQWYNLQALCVHQKKCIVAKDMEPLSLTTLLVQSAFMAGRLDYRASTELRIEVLPFMRQQTTAVIMEDPLLVTCGNQCLLEKTMASKQKRLNYTKTVLIRAARLKIELNGLRLKSEGNMADFLTVEHFQHVVKAAALLVRKDYNRGVTAGPRSRKVNLQKNLVELIKKLTVLKLTMALDEKDSQTRREARQFLRCFSVCWPSDLIDFDMKKMVQDVESVQWKGDMVGAGEGAAVITVKCRELSEPEPLVSSQQLPDTIDNHVHLPFVEDVEKLCLHVDQELGGLQTREAGCSFHTMGALAMARMVLTNPNVASWLPELRSETYIRSCLETDESSAQAMTAVTGLWRLVAADHDVIILDDGGVESIVFVPHTIAHFLNLLSKPDARAAAGVSPENPYLFATTGQGSLEVCDVLHEVAQQAVLLDAGSFLCTANWPYVATILQALQLSRLDSDVVAAAVKASLQSLGVSTNPSGVLCPEDLAKVLLLSLCMESKKWKDCSLDAIQIRDVLKVYSSAGQDLDMDLDDLELTLDGLLVEGSVMKELLTSVLPEETGGEVTTKSSPSFVQVAKFRKVGGRRNKLEDCLFCGKTLSSKISRHYLTIHKDKAVVQDIMSHPVNSNARRVRMVLLLQEGHFKQNLKVYMQEVGELSVARRSCGPDGVVDPFQNLPCEFCMNFVRKHVLARHMRTTCLKKPEEAQVLKWHVQNSFIMLALFISDTDDQEAQNLLDVAVAVSDDQIKHVCLSDTLIMKYVTAFQILLSKGLVKNRDDSIIHLKIIQLGRLLLLLNEAKSVPLSLSCYMAAEHWEEISEVILRIACEESTEKALWMGQAVRQVNLMQLSEAIYSGDCKLQDEVKDFKKEYETRWHGVELLIKGIDRWKKIMAFICEHNLAADVKSMSDSLINKMKEISELECTTSQDWSEYATLLLARIRLFNRCRVGRIARMSNEEFENRKMTAENDKLTQDLVTKLLVNRLDRVTIDEEVQVLLTKDMIEGMVRLRSTRGLTGPPAENPWVFPDCEDSHMDGKCALKVISGKPLRAWGLSGKRQTQFLAVMARYMQLLEMTREELSTLWCDLSRDLIQDEDLSHVRVVLLRKLAGDYRDNTLIKIAVLLTSEMSEDDWDKRIDIHQDPSMLRDLQRKCSTTTSACSDTPYEPPPELPLRASHCNVPWSHEELDILDLNFIPTIGCYPSTADIRQVIDGNPSLQRRTVPQVKSKLQHLWGKLK